MRAIFDPSPFEVGKAFPESQRPTLAFEPPTLFQTETLTLLELIAKGSGIENSMALQIMAMEEFEHFEHKLPSTLLALYAQILNAFMREGNAENYTLKPKGWKEGDSKQVLPIYNRKDGYKNLVYSKEISFVLNWIYFRFMERATELLHEKYPDMTRVDVSKKSDALFRTSKVTGMPSMSDTHSIFGAIFDGSDDDEIVTMYEMDEDDEGDEQLKGIYEELETHSFYLADMLDLLRDVYNRPSPFEDKAEDTQEPTEKPVEKKKITLQEIATLILQTKAPKGYKVTEDYSFVWTIPPPISPIEVYSFENLKGPEAAFFVDTFLDLHQSQAYLLSMHFVLRRLMELWKKNSDITIEASLFSGENQILLSILKYLTNKIPELFGARFLAMEGITVLGERLTEYVDLIFVPNTETPISVYPFLEKLLDVIRDGCMCLERIRISMLYGKSHSSYIGDEFLASYFALVYQTRFAETAYDSLLAVVEPLGLLSLPKDMEKTNDFYMNVKKRFPEEVKRKGIAEVHARREYDLNNGKRRILDSQGELKPLTQPSHIGQALFKIQEKIWKTPRVEKEFELVTEKPKKSLMLGRAKGKIKKETTDAGNTDSGTTASNV